MLNFVFLFTPLTKLGITWKILFHLQVGYLSKKGKKKIAYCESKCNFFYKLWFVSQSELMLILNCCRYYIDTAF